MRIRVESWQRIVPEPDPPSSAPNVDAVSRSGLAHALGRSPRPEEARVHPRRWRHSPLLHAATNVQLLAVNPGRLATAHAMNMNVDPIPMCATAAKQRSCRARRRGYADNSRRKDQTDGRARQPHRENLAEIFAQRGKPARSRNCLPSREAADGSWQTASLGFSDSAPVAGRRIRWLQRNTYSGTPRAPLAGLVAHLRRLRR